MIHGEELNKLLQLAGKLGLFYFTLHAQKERLAEDITAEEVREVLRECELLEE